MFKKHVKYYLSLTLVILTFQLGNGIKIYGLTKNWYQQGLREVVPRMPIVVILVGALLVVVLRIKIAAGMIA